MNPLARLQKEHTQIRRVVEAMTALLDGRSGQRPLPPTPFLALQRFILRYADGSHHVKEERVLFPALAGLTFDKGDQPLAELDREHEQARRYAEVLGAAARACQAGDARHEAELVAATRAWCALTAAHLDREEAHLFRFARRHLPYDVQRALPGRFALVDPLSAADFTDAATAVVDAAGAGSGRRSTG